MNGRGRTTRESGRIGRPVSTCRSLYSPYVLVERCRVLSTPYAKSKGRCMHAPVSYQEQTIEDDDYLLLLCDRARRYLRT